MAYKSYSQLYQRMMNESHQNCVLSTYQSHNKQNYHTVFFKAISQPTNQSNVYCQKSQMD